ncbi:MAG: hypothetical protein FWD43_00085 [Coriobacteriia bacterium]|nr:hypothetical protein [Coriobacteriia bacterium]
MGTHEAYELAALINKPKGMKGEVVAVAPDGLPLSLFEGLSVWIVPPTLKGVRATQVKRLRSQKGGLLVKLDGVDSLDDARALVGRHLLARIEDIKDFSRTRPEGNTVDDKPESIVGSAVYDEADGYIGIVVRVEDTPAHPLLVVTRDAGCNAKCDAKTDGVESLRFQSNPIKQSKPEILIPYVDEFIIACREGRFDVRLPSGLLELNQKKRT